MSGSEYLEAGMHAAYGPAPEPDSVLARLDPHGRLASRVVLLPEAAAAAPPARKGALADGGGRYQIVGEIARGGVGVVLKGHDVDLGRDVAMKILRDEHADNDDILQRFIEEAQIGAQLQHPGIVPVYEVGVRGDQRPYFTMKLIRGRTLASMLGEREKVSQDRRRFLSIFESIGQTMAYAHARGVIHRDLKPANVMVGAFGEVLVVDWGLGKVLTQGGVADERKAKRIKQPELSVISTVRSEGTGSESLVGSVMGTPRYMPPEQARGEIEQLDERADVFALGAILCEILTGKPPYAAVEERDAFMQAVRADLGDATARLDRCGADDELVGLAKSCLAPAPMARPKDASVVVRELGGYLASVEERAKAAQRAAAESRVKTEEERKRRKLSLALSAVVLALLVLGGGGWYLVEEGRRGRADEAARAVGLAIEGATLLRSKATAGEDLGAWKEAVSAARGADSIARSGDAEESVRARTASMLAEFEAEDRATRARADGREKDEAMVARLDEIRVGRSEHWETEPAARAYAEAFRGYGLDPEGAGTVGALAAEVRSSPVASALVGALDEWRRLCVRSDPPLDGLAARLGALLEAADPDPWRTRLRAARSLEELQALVPTADVSSMPIASLLDLVDRLGTQGDGRGAAELAGQIDAARPGDFWVNFLAGLWNVQSFPPRADDAIRFYTAALALRPGSAPWVRTNLALALSLRGDHVEAIAMSREVLRLRPDMARSHRVLSVTLRSAGDPDGALASLREAIRIDPRDAATLVELGRARQDKGDFDGAIEAYREAIQFAPGLPEAHNNLGSALTAEGDLPGAIAAARESLRLRQDNPSAHLNLGNALRATDDLDGAIAEYRKALRLWPDWALAHTNMGNVLKAKGDIDGAVAAHREAVRLAPGLAAVHQNLGSSLRSRGDLEESLAASREAARLAPTDPRPVQNVSITLLDLGDMRGAIEEARRALQLAPAQAEFHRALGFVLSASGDFAGSIGAHREAVRLDPRSATFRRFLGIALRYGGALDEATVHLREAVRLAPGDSEAHERLGEALQRATAFEEAAREFRSAAELSASKPEERARSLRRAELAERQAALGPRLPDVLRGTDRPASVEEEAQFAALAYLHGFDAGSAALYARALERADVAAAAGWRYDAACSAALAGTGKGKDADTLSDAERARWRARAIEWLQAELALVASGVEAGGRAANEQVRTTMVRWLADRDFAGIREELQIRRLPAPEQEACRALWRDVDALFSKAGGKR